MRRGFISILTYWYCSSLGLAESIASICLSIVGVYSVLSCLPKYIYLGRFILAVEFYVAREVLSFVLPI